MMSRVIDSDSIWPMTWRAVNDGHADVLKSVVDAQPSVVSPDSTRAETAQVWSVGDRLKRRCAT